MKRQVLKVLGTVVLIMLSLCGFAAAADNVTKAGNYYYYLDEGFKYGTAIIYRVDSNANNVKAIISVNGFAEGIHLYENKLYFSVYFEESDVSYLCYIDLASPKLKQYKKGVKDFIIIGDILYYTIINSNYDRISLHARNIKTGKETTIHNKKDDDVYIEGKLGNRLLYNIREGDVRVYDYPKSKSVKLFGNQYRMNYAEHGGYCYFEEKDGIYRYKFDKPSLSLKERHKMKNLGSKSLLFVANGYAYMTNTENIETDSEGYDRTFDLVLYRQKLTESKSVELYRYENEDDVGYSRLFTNCGNFIWEYMLSTGEMGTPSLERITDKNKIN